mgnify:CR=1 FL=1
MLPSIFGENLFDDFFDDDFFRMPAWTGRDPLYGKRGKNLMKTDVRETDTSYELDVDLPGFKKDEINVDLQNGYLTIQASKGLDKDQKDQQGRYIRQERYAGACSRSFYVGDTFWLNVRSNWTIIPFRALSCPSPVGQFKQAKIPLVSSAVKPSSSTAFGYLAALMESSSAYTRTLDTLGN